MDYNSSESLMFNYKPTEEQKEQKPLADLVKATIDAEIARLNSLDGIENAENAVEEVKVNKKVIKILRNIRRQLK